MRSGSCRYNVTVAACVLGWVVVTTWGSLAAAQQRNPNYSALYVINADGTGWRKLLEVPGFAALGSPDCSRDGKYVAFDAYQSQLGKIWSDCRVMVASLDGGSLVDLVHGNMPVFSADGRFVTCSRPSPERGVWIVAVDGSDPELLDEGGWSAQWSPDGKTIAWYRGRDLILYDVGSTERREISTPSDQGELYLNYNIAWGPKSDLLGYFVSKRDETCDLVVVTVADEPQFKRLCNAKNPGFDIAWHPDGDRIAVPLQDPEHGRLQIYTLNPDTEDPPARLEGQDAQRRNVSVCWTADGRELIVVSYDR